MAKGLRQNIVHKVFAITGTACLLAFSGCNNGTKFPDSIDAVKTALAQNNLKNIQISQDQYKGIITLTGTVPTEEQKILAQSVAMESAATYTVQDQITVVPTK